MSGDDEIEIALHQLAALLQFDRVILRADRDAIRVLVSTVTSERAKRARAEHALADALDRVERFEAQAAEHWLRLSRCRGILCDPEATEEDRQAVLKATATDDAPAMDAIERAHALLDFPRA